MSKSNSLLTVVAVVLFTPAAMAQDSDRQREQAQERERAAVDMEVREAEQQRIEIERRAEDVELEMREAEKRMAEAAQRIAELSTRQLPGMHARQWSTRFGDKPVLGITIGGEDEPGPVAGIEVIGVSPGGAAAEAGLRAGDVITAVNSESLSADSGAVANRRLLDFMAGVEEGDVVEVEYLRAGKSARVDVAPRPISSEFFSFQRGGPDVHVEMAPTAPAAPGAPLNRYVFITRGQAWGDMEMVSLTKDLGRYFGTDEGLLVVRAPEDEAFKLRDGDVILEVDGRTPKSVSHAIRILGSYQDGERLKIRIMRDKSEQTLDIQLPDDRTGAAGGGAVPPPEPRIQSRLRIAPRIRLKTSGERI